MSTDNSFGCAGRSRARFAGDAIGDGWNADQQGADNVIVLNNPAARPTDGYAGLFTNGGASITISLYRYPDRNTALMRLTPTSKTSSAI